MTHVPSNPAAARFAFDNTYARELEGFYVTWKAAQVAQPRLVKLNSELAEELGLDAGALDSEEGARIFAGNETPQGAAPLAQAYAGHQFGGFVPQLGDGRALLLGEVIDRNGRRRDIQLKGSGRTPFSRAGDGRAALGPVLREYLIGEAMHALGIPTTRALAAVVTGEPVFREEGALPGAVLTRVAASHIRVGTFQFFAARGEQAKVRQLADYVIDNKKRLDCFHGTDLKTLLEILRVKNVILMGINTNTCVLNTAFTAFNHDYCVVVASDCVASMYGDDLHVLGLQNVARCLGWVFSNEDIKAKLEQGAVRND